MGALNDIQIRHWIKAAAPVAKSDGDGLTFTLSAAGTASWVLRYRYGGKQREKTIGKFPDISLKRLESWRLQTGCAFNREWTLDVKSRLRSTNRLRR